MKEQKPARAPVIYLVHFKKNNPGRIPDASAESRKG